MAVRVVLDRVEGPVAVLSVLDGDFGLIELPATALPAGARDGDTLSLELSTVEDDRRSDLQARMDRLAGMG
jgi:hypothetical protein